MRAIVNSLSFKVGSIIVLVEVIALTIAGIVYLNNFSAQVDRRLEAAVSLPGKLLNAGLLEFNAVNSSQIIREVVGEDVRNALLIASNNVIFFSSDAALIGKDIHTLATLNNEALDLAQTGGEPLLVQDETKLVSVSPIFGPDGRTPRFYAYLEVGNSEAVAQKRAIAEVFILGTLATVAVTSLIIFLSFNATVLRRILDVANILKQVENGNLSARVTAPVSKDEIGQLQSGVNSMLTRLESLVGTLEERVAARTRDLSVAASVSLHVTTFLDLNTLLKEIVTQTAKGFDLYHASIYLYDEATGMLKYKAGSGEVADHHLAENKQFALNDLHGLVPKAAQTHKAVVVNDVTTDPTHFKNPLLPNTRSEAALPMVVANQLLGVLDLQAERTDRFKEEDLRVMTLLAEQVAVAVQNAYLYDYQVKVADDLKALDNMKSQFLASMSHELRTPLNAILNFAKFILMGLFGSITDKQKDGLDKIVGSAQHLLALINDVLDITKIESGMMKLFVEADVNPQDELHAVTATAETLLADRPIQLKQRIDPDLPTMVGDKRRIRQILLNIVSNACKFTEQGSITIIAKKLTNEILFAVEDTGPGIAPEDLDIIFEPFQQAEHGIKHAGGTGLGLPISKKLVEAHHGRLWVESVVGKGSTFFISLPVRDQKLLESMEVSAKEVSINVA